MGIVCTLRSLRFILLCLTVAARCVGVCGQALGGPYTLTLPERNAPALGLWDGVGLPDGGAVVVGNATVGGDTLRDVGAWRAFVRRYTPDHEVAWTTYFDQAYYRDRVIGVDLSGDTANVIVATDEPAGRTSFSVRVESIDVSSGRSLRARRLDTRALHGARSVYSGTTSNGVTLLSVSLWDVENELFGFGQYGAALFSESGDLSFAIATGTSSDHAESWPGADVQLYGANNWTFRGGRPTELDVLPRPRIEGTSFVAQHFAISADTLYTLTASTNGGRQHLSVSRAVVGGADIAVSSRTLPDSLAEASALHIGHWGPDSLVVVLALPRGGWPLRAYAVAKRGGPGVRYLGSLHSTPEEQSTFRRPLLIPEDREAPPALRLLVHVGDEGRAGVLDLLEGTVVARVDSSLSSSPRLGARYYDFAYGGATRRTFALYSRSTRYGDGVHEIEGQRYSGNSMFLPDTLASGRRRTSTSIIDLESFAGGRFLATAHNSCYEEIGCSRFVSVFDTAGAVIATYRMGDELPGLLFGISGQSDGRLAMVVGDASPRTVRYLDTLGALQPEALAIDLPAKGSASHLTNVHVATGPFEALAISGLQAKPRSSTTDVRYTYLESRSQRSRLPPPGEANRDIATRIGYTTSGDPVEFYGGRYRHWGPALADTLRLRGEGITAVGGAPVYVESVVPIGRDCVLISGTLVVGDSVLGAPAHESYGSGNRFSYPWTRSLLGLLDVGDDSLTTLFVGPHFSRAEPQLHLSADSLTAFQVVRVERELGFVMGPTIPPARDSSTSDVDVPTPWRAFTLTATSPFTDGIDFRLPTSHLRGDDAPQVRLCTLGGATLRHVRNSMTIPAGGGVVEGSIRVPPHLPSGAYVLQVGPTATIVVKQ